MNINFTDFYLLFIHNSFVKGGYKGTLVPLLNDDSRNHIDRL